MRTNALFILPTWDEVLVQKYKNSYAISLIMTGIQFWIMSTGFMESLVTTDSAQEKREKILKRMSQMGLHMK